MKTIYICWTDEFTNKKHAALWLFSGNDDDVFKAQEYVGNIGGKVLTYLAVLYKGDVADAHKQVQEFYDKITLAKLYR